MADLFKTAVEQEIARRARVGKLLAQKFPELAGLSYAEFIERCPFDLDFITSCEMHDALRKEGEDVRRDTQKG